MNLPNSNPGSNPQATWTANHKAPRDNEHLKPEEFHRYLLDLTSQYAKEFNVETPSLSFDIVMLPSLPLEHAAEAIGEALQVLKLAVPELIRNSIQHGIEAQAEREQKGKPALGNIVATALFGRNRIELHFWDDGQGLNINDLYIQGEELELLDIIPSPDVDDIAALLVNEAFIKQTREETNNNPGLINIKRVLAQKDYKLLLRATSDEIEEGFTSFKCVLKKNIH